LSGLYHAVGSVCISKYEFGLRLAQTFGFNASLVIPTSVEDSGLLAARSPNLTLSVEKLAQDLGEPIPSLSTGLGKFYAQYQQGYPQRLLKMAIQNNGVG
jgi:dTDP-4-dehydrorhamnose reductase